MHKACVKFVNNHRINYSKTMGYTNTDTIKNLYISNIKCLKTIFITKVITLFYSPFSTFKMSVFIL